MKSHVNFVYDVKDDPSDELKHWLFLENVRIRQEKQDFQEEKQRFINEKLQVDKEIRDRQLEIDAEERKLQKRKELFEKQWQLMENELRRLARDKAQLEKERENLIRMQNQARVNINNTGNSRFFAGVNSAGTLKKRYRDLLKIYHPDNESGDETTVHCINQEYKNLKRQYGID